MHLRDGNEPRRAVRGAAARLEARAGKEDQLDELLRTGRQLALAEPATVTWYAFRTGESTFGIFDTFEGDAGRQAHLNGQIAAALGSPADELLAPPPSIQPVDVIASK